MLIGQRVEALRVLGNESFRDQQYISRGRNVRRGDANEIQDAERMHQIAADADVEKDAVRIQVERWK
jgi:hypothetical protein